MIHPVIEYPKNRDKKTAFNQFVVQFPILRIASRSVTTLVFGSSNYIISFLMHRIVNDCILASYILA